MKILVNHLVDCRRGRGVPSRYPESILYFFHNFWDLNSILNFQNDIVLIISGLWANEGLFLILITSPTPLYIPPLISTSWKDHHTPLESKTKLHSQIESEIERNFCKSEFSTLFSTCFHQNT